MPGAAPASTPGSPSSTAARRPASSSIPRPAPPTPPRCSMPSSPACRPGCPSGRSRCGPQPAPAGTCSATPSPNPPPDAPRRSLRHRRSRPRTGVPSSSSPSRPAPRIPAQTPPPPFRPPALTRRGARAWCGFLAPSSIRPRWCSPPPWPRCRIRRRRTARFVLSAWSPTGSSRTPSSRASYWRAKPIRAISPPTTASARAGRPSSAVARTAMRTTTMRTIPGPSPPTARCCRRRSGSAAAGCWETAPERARAGRSPPWCSTTGCAAGSGRSGSRSPTSWSRTRAATGPRSAEPRPTCSRSPTSARARTSRSPRGSCSRPTRRCARRPARASSPGSTRSWNGWPAAWRRTTATLIKASSCSTRRTRWPTPPARRAIAARSSRRSRAAPDCACKTRCRTRASPMCPRPAPPPSPVSPTPDGSACGPPAIRRSRPAPISCPRWRREGSPRWRWSRGT